MQYRWLRRSRALMLAMATAFAAASAAATQPAQTQQDPEQIACRQHFDASAIRVLTQPLRETLDLSLDTATLTALEGKAASQRVLGRTTASLRNSSSLRTIEKKLPSGRSCLLPEVTVAIAYEPTVVFVGKEYPAGSCEFGKILEHEQRHVAEHRRHLAALALLLQQDLREFFTTTALVFDLPSYSRRIFQTGIQDVIRSRFNAMSADARARQLEIDSTEEIARLSDLRRLCGQQETTTGPKS
ncbi:MAG: hypothetical protein WCR74_22025 [Betaproteobacteria bacterium]